jgi:hypothetical protein
VLFLSARGILISLVGLSNHGADPHLGRHALPEIHPSTLRSITREFYHFILRLTCETAFRNALCTPINLVPLGEVLVSCGICPRSGPRCIICTAWCARANARTIVWAGYHLQRWVLNRQAPNERYALEEARYHHGGRTVRSSEEMRILVAGMLTLLYVGIGRTGFSIDEMPVVFADSCGFRQIHCTSPVLL